MIGRVDWKTAESKLSRTEHNINIGCITRLSSDPFVWRVTPTKYETGYASVECAADCTGC